MINQGGGGAGNSSTNNHLINTYQQNHQSTHHPILAANSINKQSENAWQQIMLTVMNRKRLECG